VKLPSSITSLGVYCQSLLPTDFFSDLPRQLTTLVLHATPNHQDWAEALPRTLRHLEIVSSSLRLDHEISSFLPPDLTALIMPNTIVQMGHHRLPERITTLHLGRLDEAFRFPPGLTLLECEVPRGSLPPDYFPHSLLDCKITLAHVSWSIFSLPPRLEALMLMEGLTGGLGMGWENQLSVKLNPNLRRLLLQLGNFSAHLLAAIESLVSLEELDMSTTLGMPLTCMDALPASLVFLSLSSLKEAPKCANLLKLPNRLEALLISAPAIGWHFSESIGSHSLEAQDQQLPETESCWLRLKNLRRLSLPSWPTLEAYGDEMLRSCFPRTLQSLNVGYRALWTPWS
jgi:hypothetical protein